MRGDGMPINFFSRQKDLPVSEDADEGTLS